MGEDKETTTIVFEGVDRSGKDTLIDKLKTNLEKEGYSVGLYRNPDHPVRDMLLSTDTDLNEYENALVFYAGYLHTERRIKESDYDIALINRRLLSTCIYQKMGDVISFSDFKNIFDYKKILQVDLTIVLSVDRDVIKERINNVKLDKNDRFESKAEKLYERAEMYDRLIPKLSKHGMLETLTKEIKTLKNNDKDDLTFNTQFLIAWVLHQMN